MSKTITNLTRNEFDQMPVEEMIKRPDPFGCALIALTPYGTTRSGVMGPNEKISIATNSDEEFEKKG